MYLASCFDEQKCSCQRPSLHLLQFTVSAMTFRSKLIFDGCLSTYAPAKSRHSYRIVVLSTYLNRVLVVEQVEFGY